ncbi:ribosome maturation factor RimP [Lysobacter sp. SG-8]|uniref:Ribosome maturation factor RimP n=1 Tax=Marilutibacter penaei TaxID=2759900 RepID=A0A7W3YD79_9GAMM|nr:ribosome maturation factor RimP [Lysobacter penaei]
MTDKASQISDLLAPTVASLGLELLGVEYLPSPGGAIVRLYIDIPEAETSREGEAPRSVGIDECEAVSREVSAQLDVEDPISGNYTLEVSSPGIDRPLFTAAHFRRFLGASAKVVLRLPQDGRRRLQARISGIEDDAVVFDLDGTAFTVAIDNIEKARLVPDWAALGMAPSRPGKGGKGEKNTRKPTNKPAADGSSTAE